ncbi:MAG: tetratricopeptide repeat protein [Planctomycetota bacterium]|nr:MAG: tetratricopeptide repeat protein [Planctomycetota bacterium]
MATATIDLQALGVPEALDETELETIWERTEKTHGADASALLALGLALDAAGHHREAIRTFERALERAPDDPEVLFRLAYAHELHGDEEAALEYYGKLADRPRPHVGALVNYGLMLEDRGRYEEAAEVFRRVLAADPTHRRARMFLGDAEASLDMYYDEEQARRSDRRNAILRIPISDFELSVRARNCLNKMNIRTLGDLVVKTEEELLSYKNFGDTSLTEIKQLLAQKGLQLGMFRDGQLPSAGKGGSATARPAAAGAATAGAAAPGGEIDLEAVRARPISDLSLSVRSRNCMERLGIKTLGELADRTEAEMLAVKNFGQTSLNEVKKKLAAFGLSLRKA